jgi:hypothetical protein
MQLGKYQRAILYVCYRYAKYSMDYREIEPVEILTIEELTNFIKLKLLTDKGTLAPYYARPTVIGQQPQLREGYATLRALYPNAVSPAEAVYCFLNGKPFGCKVCGDRTKFIDMNKGYRPYCSGRCYLSQNMESNLHRLTDQQKELKSRNLSLVMTGRKFSPESREKMSATASRADVKRAKALTCKRRYGVENPGVLGAYSSRAASQFILRFIEYFGIEKERCLFKTETQHEFFQNVAVSWSSKKRYVSYDLVVFKTPAACSSHRTDDIDMVLEYQGPWHYSPEEITGHEDEPATPYPRSLSKIQTLEIDIAKRERIREVAPGAVYLTHWWKTNRTLRML